MHRSHRLGVACLLFAAWSHAARAQSPADTTATAARRPVSAWLSWGGGPGSFRGTSPGLADGMHRANLSVGPLLLTYRSGDLGPAFLETGDGVRDQAILVGVRSPGRRAFGSAALGYARGEQYQVGFGACGDVATPCAHASALAVDLSMHVNWIVPGLALSYSGTFGPARVAYSAYTLALELGWFGR